MVAHWQLLYLHGFDARVMRMERCQYEMCMAHCKNNVNNVGLILLVNLHELWRRLNFHDKIYIGIILGNLALVYEYRLW